MKVFRAMAYGFDSTAFIIAAKNYDDAIEIARNADMGTVDVDDVWELHSLQTNVMTAQIIEQF